MLNTLCPIAAATLTAAAFATTANGWTPWPSPSLVSRSYDEARKPSNSVLCEAHSSRVFGRREVLASAAGIVAAIGGSARANATDGQEAGSANEKQRYALEFPTLFAPLYGEAYRETIKRPLGRSDGEGNTIWALEQNLELGPLQTPVRCTVVRLVDGTLWVHAPLAPTREFFEMVEACGDGGRDAVAHVVVPTYALEHKVFVKDALRRWPDARLWTSPGQFSFPFAASEEFVFGKAVTGVLGSSDDDSRQSRAIPPWRDEIEYATLEAGTFNIGGRPTTLCETAFFHKASKSLIVTDALARIPTEVPPLNNPARLLLIAKRSTSDPMPEDTPQSRMDGWEKTALLVSYFFPEHEELDPNQAGVVTWTEGWHDNFDALAGRLLVPPVVRTLLYSQNPARVQRWVDRVADGRWEFNQIVPAHFEAPIAATPEDVARAFRFLRDDGADAFPQKDLARGLAPIADIASKL